MSARSSALLKSPVTSSVDLFYAILRIRLIEEAIVARYSDQLMRCPVHLSIGQEGVAVGVCKAVLHTDYLVSNHRAHAHYLAKGGDFKKMLAEIYGKSTGCCGGRGGSMHLMDTAVGMYGSTPIVGGSIPVGVGIAFAAWLKGEKTITVVFLGEGATEEGVFAESLNFAALKKLPVLFVCENNLYSVYSPLAVRQPPGRNRVALAAAHGIHAEQGFGNDVEEVHRLAAKAVEMIRGGSGPVFLEFATYRHREHCGPNYDNHIGYRTEQEYLDWEKKCPVRLQRDRLLGAGLATSQDLAFFQQSIESEIEAAFLFAQESPFPVYDPDQETPYAGHV